jgi:S1-C subfamily serine protease
MEKANLSLIFIGILLLFQIFSLWYFSSVNQNLVDELNVVRGELEIVEGNSLENKGLINENSGGLSLLTANLIKTQEDLSEQEEQIQEISNLASEDFSGVIEDVVKAVVSVRTDVSQGSGFIINEDGYVVTNYHVIDGAEEIQVLTYEKGLKSAELIGSDPTGDVALLKISWDYDYLEFDDSDDVRIGEKVIAVGNPHGLSFSVTEGIISALNRNGFSNEEAYIQTDVPLNPGNSGGPLINKAGKVIGVNNWKIGGAESLGFALESNYAIDLINNIAVEEIGEEIL